MVGPSIADRLLHVEVEVRVPAAPVDLHGEMIGRPQSRQRLERVLGAGQVEAVDALEPISGLEPENAEGWPRRSLA